MRASLSTKPSTAPGFTLIELVLVIVILGTLSAVAMSKFISVDDEARSSAMQTLASSISTGSAINTAAAAVRGSGAFSVREADVCTAASLSRFSRTPLPSDVVVSPSGVSCSSATVASVQCQISAGGQSATLDVQCATLKSSGGPTIRPGRPSLDGTPTKGG